MEQWSDEEKEMLIVSISKAQTNGQLNTAVSHLIKTKGITKTLQDLYEYSLKIKDEYYKDLELALSCLTAPIENMPPLINHEYPFVRGIAQWRLKIGR